MLAEATFRKSLSILPDDIACNISWVTAQLKINPNVHFTYSEPLTTFTSAAVACILDNVTGETVEILTYIDPSVQQHFAWDKPWVRVKILPKPDNWPERPPSGYSSTLPDVGASEMDTD